MGEGWSYLGIIGRSGCGADFRKIIDYSENVIFRILVLWNVNRCYVQKKMFPGVNDIIFLNERGNKGNIFFIPREL